MNVRFSIRRDTLDISGTNRSLADGDIVPMRPYGLNRPLVGVVTDSRGLADQPLSSAIIEDRRSQRFARSMVDALSTAVSAPTAQVGACSQPPALG